MVEHGEPSSPPIDFPVYGLNAFRPDRRWFDYYQAKDGDHVWAVGLGHRYTTGIGGVIVSTLRPSHYELNAIRNETDPLTEVALDGAIRLGNATLPEIDFPRPHGLLKSLVDHMQYQSEHYQDWPVARWKVAGNLITGPILNFADGWTTFTDAVPGVYVSVLGLNTPPAASLERIDIADLREYGLDREARLSPALMTEARMRHADAKLPSRKLLHADFLGLIS